jgi:hypothetical protein
MKPHFVIYLPKVMPRYERTDRGDKKISKVRIGLLQTQGAFKIPLQKSRK